MINSTLQLSRACELTRDNVTYWGQGVNGSVGIGQTGNIDFKVTDDCFLTGGQLNVKNGTFGDGCDMQVVDKDLVYQNQTVPGTPYTYAQAVPTYPILAQFMTNCQIVENFQKQMDFDTDYVAKILGGMYLRMVYRSTGNGVMTSVQVSANYSLHKAKY